MVNKNQITLAAALSLFTASLYAYTDIKAPLIPVDENSMEAYRGKAGTRMAIQNTVTIASKLKYRGVNLSNNEPGIKNELQGSFYRGPMRTFLMLDMYEFSSNLNPNTVTGNSTYGGGTMIGSGIGGELFFNKCHSSGIKMYRSIYQWPNIDILRYNSGQLDFNDNTAYPASIKPVKATTIGLSWRSYNLLASTADTSSMKAQQASSPITWPFTWNDYVSAETPNFKMTDKINMKARYGYWKSNGIETNADFNMPLAKNIDAFLRVYNFKSFLWTQSDKIGIVLMMKFKTTGNINITLPSICQ